MLNRVGRVSESFKIIIDILIRMSSAIDEINDILVTGISLLVMFCALILIIFDDESPGMISLLSINYSLIHQHLVD
jgi:hypothetical protein